jgi:hypothetical protein
MIMTTLFVPMVVTESSSGFHSLPIADLEACTSAKSLLKCMFALKLNQKLIFVIVIKTVILILKMKLGCKEIWLLPSFFCIICFD